MIPAKKGTVVLNISNCIVLLTDGRMIHCPNTTLVEGTKVWVYTDLNGDVVKVEERYEECHVPNETVEDLDDDIDYSLLDYIE